MTKVKLDKETRLNMLVNEIFSCEQNIGMAFKHNGGPTRADAKYIKKVKKDIKNSIIQIGKIVATNNKMYFTWGNNYLTTIRKENEIIS